MAVKTPKEWQKAEYQPLIEATTYYGNKVMIPEKFQFAWEMATVEAKEMVSKGMDPQDGLANCSGLRYAPYEVYLEVYEELNYPTEN